MSGIRGVDVVSQFEEEVADYCGSNFAIAVNSCTNAIGLCLQWLKRHGQLPEFVDCPAHTYLGVPMQIALAGAKIAWRKSYAWDDRGYYHLRKTPIIDSARLFTKGMYVENSLMCTSHHWTKTLGMEQGGCILTDDVDIADWLGLSPFFRMESSSKPNRIGSTTWPPLLGVSRPPWSCIQWIPSKPEP